MTRIHDMGGRFGDGAVVPEREDDPVFHEDWHARALALTLAGGALGQWNIDIGRYARECLPPADYARFSYYEKWLGGLVGCLIDAGLVREEELSGSVSPQDSPAASRRLIAEDVATLLAKGGPADRPTDIAPMFEIGDAVVTRKITANRLVEGGHTRLPAYAAGAVGRVKRYHGTHVLPDSSAHRLGDAAEPLYAVCFPASELWAAPEHPNDEVVLDLWQSYLAPA